jgi:hypothetical protein
MRQVAAEDKWTGLIGLSGVYQAMEKVHLGAGKKPMVGWLEIP